MLGLMNGSMRRSEFLAFSDRMLGLAMKHAEHHKMIHEIILKVRS